jgi:iron uptake system component EfeO
LVRSARPRTGIVVVRLNRLQRARALVATAAAAAMLGLTALSACGQAPSSATTSPDVITITPRVCGAGWRHPKPGLQTLEIRNSSPAVVEVTLISPVNLDTYAKLEGVGPGTTRALPVDLGSGVYRLLCEGNDYASQINPVVRVPGNVAGGVGIAPVSISQQISATSQEEAYVARGLATLAGEVGSLAQDIKAGQLQAARVEWLAGHMTFERLGSAYGMFGSYDDEINGTPFGLPGGVSSPNFTGFYRLEYGLWHGQSAAQLTGPANELVIDVRGLRTGWQGMQMQPPFALSDLALRTHEVLENAMQFQLSGIDNFGSGTNMATVSAGIDATRAQLAILHPLLVGRYQDLSSLYSWLERLQRLVDAAHTAAGWTPVSRLPASERELLDSAAGQTVELLAQIPPLFEAKPQP